MIAADFHILMHALSPLDCRGSLEQPSLAASPAATELPPHGNGPLERANSPASGLQTPISHIDGGAPRAGVNLITVCGQQVKAVVINHGYGDYTAAEEEYDLGRPNCWANSALQALKDLQELLEERELRRRDRDFAQTLARAMR